MRSAFAAGVSHASTNVATQTAKGFDISEDVAFHASVRSVRRPGKKSYLRTTQTVSVKRSPPFPFVLDELSSLRPVVKQLFGFTYVYLDETLLCSLRDSPKQPGSNGMWLFTSTEEIDSLAREFPNLPRRQLWRSGKNAWLVLASRLEDFEEYAFKACELILKRDRRIGRVRRIAMKKGGRHV
ncbi:MAG: hypothetical protein ABI967_04475 [bacterium]